MAAFFVVMHPYSMILNHDTFSIQLTGEDDFPTASQDISKHYKTTYQSSPEFIPSSKYGIRVVRNGIEISNAIILESAGATRLNQHSALIKGDTLFICCSNQVYALKIPTLDLIWRLEPDWATCFEIHEFNDDLLVWGETSVSRIDPNGNIKWEFSGCDIFLTLDGTPAFKVDGDLILLTDWQGFKYQLNANGEATQL